MSKNVYLPVFQRVKYLMVQIAGVRYTGKNMRVNTDIKEGKSKK